MAQVIAVIEQIIDAMKTFISDVEKEGEKIVTDLAIFSEHLSSELLQLMKQVFEDIKSEITNIINDFKSIVTQLTRRLKVPRHTGGAGILKKLKEASSKSFEKLSSLTRDFGNAAGKLLNDTRNGIKTIAGTLEQTVDKTFDDAKQIGKDSVEKIVKIGESAISEIDNASKTISKEFEIGEEFVYKHAVTVSTTATFSFFDPFLAAALVLSGGMVVAAAKYEVE